MSVLKSPVEHYAEEINGVCERLYAVQGDLSNYSVLDALKKLGERGDPDHDGGGDSTWDAVATAMAYCLRGGGPAEEGLEGYGSYSPLWTMPTGDGQTVRRYPAEPAEVRDGTRSVWRALAAVETLDPLVRARLCDLLWELRDGPAPHTHAEAAISCLIEHSRRGRAEPLGREESARRAAVLAATLNKPALLSESLDAIEDIVAASLDGADDEFGIVIRCLRALTGHLQAKRKRSRCADADGRHERKRVLVERALGVYRSPDQQQALLEMAIADAENEQEAQQLRRRLIQGAESAAEDADGLLLMHRLENARKIAARHGDILAERRIRRRIEEIDMSGDMSEVTTEVEISSEEIQKCVDALLESGRGIQGPVIMLLHYGIQGVPVHSPDQTQAFIAEMQAEYPLQALFGGRTSGPTTPCRSPCRAERCGPEASWDNTTLQSSACSPGDTPGASWTGCGCSTAPAAMRWQPGSLLRESPAGWPSGSASHTNGGRRAIW